VTNNAQLTTGQLTTSVTSSSTDAQIPSAKSVWTAITTAVTGIITSITGSTPTSLSGLLKGNGSTVTTATAGTDYLAPTGSGSGLTSLNASSLSSGTVPTAQLPILLQRAFAAEKALGSVGGTVTIDCSVSSTVSLTLTSSITTLTFSNMLAMQKILIRITQGGSGSYTIAWPTSGTGMVAVWSGGNKTLQTTAGKLDCVTLATRSNGTTFDGFLGNMG
jgi:hypothetical protein